MEWGTGGFSGELDVRVGCGGRMSEKERNKERRENIPFFLFFARRCKVRTQKHALDLMH